VFKGAVGYSLEIAEMKRLTYFPLLFFSLYFSPVFSFEKVTYNFSRDPIDVVIPCHPKDAANLNRAIKSVKRYVQGVRRVIVISSEPLTQEAEWVDEKIFPFSKESIALEIFRSPEAAYWQVNRPKSRMGWIYQQFLKLFSPFYIPDISSNVLIVDADVIFFKPVHFLAEDGSGLYATGDEFNVFYFDHAFRILPELKKLYKEYSGIVHHMLFQKEVLKDMFSLIASQHGMEPWKAIARAIPVDTQKNMAFSAMSEYEIYFNFVFARTNQVKIRPLRWASACISDCAPVKEYADKGYDYVAIHIWNG
jgi:hypothetical protein